MKRKPLDSLLSFRPSSLTHCISKLFERIALSFYSSFWSLSPSYLSPRPVSALDSLLSIKFCFFICAFWMGLRKPGCNLTRFLLRSTSPRLSTLSGIPLFFINLLQLTSLFAFLFGLNLSFLTSALAWFCKI